jgi:hypothetical protein
LKVEDVEKTEIEGEMGVDGMELPNGVCKTFVDAVQEAEKETWSWIRVSIDSKGVGFLVRKVYKLI